MASQKEAYSRRDIYYKVAILSVVDDVQNGRFNEIPSTLSKAVEVGEKLGIKELTEDKLKGDVLQHLVNEAKNGSHYGKCFDYVRAILDSIRDYATIAQVELPKKELERIKQDSIVRDIEFILTDVNAEGYNAEAGQQLEQAEELSKLVLDYGVRRGLQERINNK